MNIIATYLDSMFAAYPSTPRLGEAKAELLDMMEDAYTELKTTGNSENEAVGQVIRDFGNLDELAPTLGITTDLHPNGAVHTQATSPETESTPHEVSTLAPVTLTDATG